MLSTTSLLLPPPGPFGAVSASGEGPQTNTHNATSTTAAAAPAAQTGQSAFLGARDRRSRRRAPQPWRGLFFQALGDRRPDIFRRKLLHLLLQITFDEAAETLHLLDGSLSFWVGLEPPLDLLRFALRELTVGVGVQFFRVQTSHGTLVSVPSLSSQGRSRVSRHLFSYPFYHRDRSSPSKYSRRNS